MDSFARLFVCCGGMAYRYFEVALLQLSDDFECSRLLRSLIEQADGTAVRVNICGAVTVFEI